MKEYYKLIGAVANDGNVKIIQEEFANEKTVKLAKDFYIDRFDSVMLEIKTIKTTDAEYASKEFIDKPAERVYQASFDFQAPEDFDTEDERKLIKALDELLFKFGYELKGYNCEDSWSIEEYC